MLTESRALPEDALANVAYLARSRNRIEILDALTTGPQTYREVAEVTSASRSTLERIFTELEERGWAERTRDGGYVATTVGEHVAGEFEPLVDAMAAIEHLGDTVCWLPVDDLSIGLQHFRDATVRRANPNSPTAEATYLLDLVEDAATFDVLTYIAPPLELLQEMRDAAVEGRLDGVNVITGTLLRYLREQTSQTRFWQEYLDAGTDVYCYQGRIPCNAFVVDETVLIANNRPDDGPPCEFIETTNETVLSWARELIERHRREAVRLDASDFAPDSPSPVSGRR